jgi:hypothetical protein
MQKQAKILGLWDILDKDILTLHSRFGGGDILMSVFRSAEEKFKKITLGQVKFFNFKQFKEVKL